VKISVILAHPDKGSFNHAIAAAAVQALREHGHVVSFHDLYAEQFDPILPGQEIPSGVPLSPQLKRKNEVFGDPLELIWRKCIFDLCGIKSFYRIIFRVVVTSTEGQRKEWLSEVEETVSKLFSGEAIHA